MLRIYSADLTGISLQSDISHGITDKEVMESYNRDKKWILDKNSWKYGEKLVQMKQIRCGFSIDIHIRKPNRITFYCKHGLLVTPFGTIRIQMDYDWDIDKVIGDFANEVVLIKKEGLDEN